MLEAGLRELADKEPELRSLILGSLDREGLPYENIDTVFRAEFHPLDDALNALFDLRPNETMAFNAAYGFQRAGAGTRALFSSIAATGTGGLPLVTALGHPLQPELIATAIKLMDACKPPNNHALYQFIHHNAGQMDQGAAARRPPAGDLAGKAGWERPGRCRPGSRSSTFPKRTRSATCGAAGFVPGPSTARPIRRANWRRISPTQTRRSGPDGTGVHETLRSHVRGYLRSGDRDKVDTAVDHIQATADAEAPVLGLLLKEAEGVSSTREWQQWEKRDPDTARGRGWYVFMASREVTGERDWVRALQNPSGCSRTSRSAARGCAKPKTSRKRRT